MLAPASRQSRTGLRGINYYQIEVTGPAQDCIPNIRRRGANPITILCELFAKLA